MKLCGGEGVAWARSCAEVAVEDGVVAVGDGVVEIGVAFDPGGGGGGIGAEAAVDDGVVAGVYFAVQVAVAEVGVFADHGGEVDGVSGAERPFGQADVEVVDEGEDG